VVGSKNKALALLMARCSQGSQLVASAGGVTLALCSNASAKTFNSANPSERTGKPAFSRCLAKALMVSRLTGAATSIARKPACLSRLSHATSKRLARCAPSTLAWLHSAEHCIIQFDQVVRAVNPIPMPHSGTDFSEYGACSWPGDLQVVGRRKAEMPPLLEATDHIV
jgi:hypothetical protein